MVVTELTSLRGETQVSHGGNGNVGVFGMEFKAWGPGVFRLVLEIESQRMVLEIGQAGFGGDGSASKTSGLISQN